MQSNSERRGKRRGSSLSAGVVVLWLAGLILALALTALEAARAGECGAAALLLALYGVLGGAAVIGVVLALRQRLREIDGGEEDDAAQY